MVRDLGIEWCAIFSVSGGSGRGNLALGFQVSTEGKKSVVMVFCVFRFPVADEKEEIMEFGTKGVAEVGSLRGGFPRRQPFSWVTT